MTEEDLDKENKSRKKEILFLFLVLFGVLFLVNNFTAKPGDRTLEEYREEAIPVSNNILNDILKNTELAKESFSVEYGRLKTNMEILKDFKKVPNFLNVKDFNYSVMQSKHYQNTYLYNFQVTYYNTEDELEQAKAVVDEMINEMLLTSDLGIMKNLELIDAYYKENYKYTYNSDVDSSVIHLTENKEGNCNAYTYLTQLVLNKLGYKTGIVSTTKYYLPHVFNVIIDNDIEYYFDGTSSEYGILKELILPHNYEIIYSI